MLPRAASRCLREAGTAKLRALAGRAPDAKSAFFARDTLAVAIHRIFLIFFFKGVSGREINTGLTQQEGLVLDFVSTSWHDVAGYVSLSFCTRWPGWSCCFGACLHERCRRALSVAAVVAHATSIQRKVMEATDIPATLPAAMTAAQKNPCKKDKGTAKNVDSRAACGKKRALGSSDS